MFIANVIAGMHDEAIHVYGLLRYARNDDKMEELFMYVVDGDKIGKRPEVRVADRVFEIDNRLSCYERINEGVKGGERGEFEVIIGEALGGEAYAEIIAMDLPYGVMNDLVIIILAAIQDLTVEEARNRFRTQKS